MLTSYTQVNSWPSHSKCSIVCCCLLKINLFVPFLSRSGSPKHDTHKHRGLLPFLGMASGASVATIYYNQPLLLEMSRTFHVSSGQVGTVAVATQVGYAAGILLFVPMGDVAERRGLIVKLFAAVTVALLAAEFAPSLWTLVAASVAIGLTASVTHVLVPIAPELAGPEESGRAIGTVMTGLLLGILLGRAASGWVAAGITAMFVPRCGGGCRSCPRYRQ